MRQVGGCWLSWSGIVVFAALAISFGCSGRTQPSADAIVQLSHEETLEWIRQHKAWQRARKVKPILARPLEREELGKEFQTADHAVERAQEGYWLCVGIAGEPWFQKKDRIDSRYERQGEEVKQFAFDTRPLQYQVLKPKGDTLNWAAQVQGTWKGKTIQAFEIRPNYDMEHPLVAPAGGYAVTDDTADPYRHDLKDVWLVQQALFESTYERISDAAAKP
jgi:hypothetical protein